ncbi:hypothetical protein SLS62_007935 [Diatrype stigma]|uniref:Siderochrome-iron transporter n=1 Tax=Diatrype stigma TaxID=117547 RepID=A0AAN9YQA6_9PEZI
MSQWGRKGISKRILGTGELTNRAWHINVLARKPKRVPSLPLELWMKIIRYITDREEAAGDPIGGMLYLWLRVRAVSHHLRTAVELVFRDLYLKQVFVGQANISPSKLNAQITWFPYARLAEAEEERSLRRGERAIFASNDFWGGRLGTAVTAAAAAPPQQQQQQQDQEGELQDLAVWLPPDRNLDFIQIADIDVNHSRREVMLDWRDVFSAFVPKVARRRARERRNPPSQFQFRPRVAYRVSKNPREIDNTTVYIYRNYAVSDFDSLSQLAALSTAGTIVFAAAKPPIAKLANVAGRGPTYALAIACYCLSYVLMAASRRFGTYAAGTVLYSVGQSGTNLLNDIVIADITTARQRALGIGLSFWPFLITPWTSALIVERVVAPGPDGGIGWRWGIGMLAILMPFCASFIIATLLYYQGKAKRHGAQTQTLASQKSKVRMTVDSLREFCSQVDVGGVVLFSGGLALLLLPLTLAATTPAQWRTPWVGGLLAAGAILLVALPFYEHRVARHPVVPPRYFASRTIVLCLVLIALDNIVFSATHTYIYAWATVAKGLGARDATFFTFVNGVTQCLVAIAAGFAMLRSRRYKWVCVLGSAVRLAGYGAMLRLRGPENSTAEIFAVQLVQGIGSGMVSTTLLVPAQVVLPHRDMPQVTALVICFAFVGGSIGSCIAGGIYTNTLEPALWNYLGSGTTAETVAALANSITGVVPDWGTPERVAVSYAVSLARI